jgi:hypothetical protein
MSDHRRLLLFATLPALCVAAIFEICLGHRHDYVGHFLAGYGATLSVTMVWMRALPPIRFEQNAFRGGVAACTCCILLGAAAEATMFRIAKFDELDFCNQNLGAVLAAICATAYIRSSKPRDSDFDYGLIAGICFVGAGGCFAVA